MSPKVSIIIVNWNGEKFLSELLDSLNKQRYRDFELIIVDNASSDGSNALIKNLVPNLEIRDTSNTVRHIHCITISMHGKPTKMVIDYNSLLKKIVR
jgi:glycosyltransferase involved in cell wall biosynthesis